MLLSLADFKVGEKGKIINLSHANLLYRHKLLAMGLTPETQFVVKRIAPLGDPVEIAVRGYRLSLRKSEAAVLEIERVLL